jgi:hypothetical protein
VVAGCAATAASDELPVSRLDLAAVLQAQLEPQRLRWSKQLPEAGELTRQLDAFRLRPVRRNEADLQAAREETGDSQTTLALHPHQRAGTRPAGIGRPTDHLFR